MGRRGFGIGAIMGGFSTYMLAKRTELMGDLAPAGSDVRLTYHMVALALMAVALLMFIRAGLTIDRTLTGRARKPAQKSARGFAAEPAEPSSFDADAALARYVERKALEPKPVANPERQPAPVHRGFGRKAV